MEFTNRKRGVAPPKPNSQMKFANDKIKIEGLKRKRRRMKLKARNNNEAIIEKFNA